MNERSQNNEEFAKESPYMVMSSPTSPRAPSPPREPPPRLPPRRDTLPEEVTRLPDGDPPKYVPPIPTSIMQGYLEKAAGKDPTRGGVWMKKYVEVNYGSLHFYNTREESEQSTGVEINLANTLVSVQNKHYIFLENNEGTRIFRAPSEVRAMKWATAISRYSCLAPTAESYCMKLSGRKNIMEERYVRLSSDGVLSWYRDEKESVDPNGTLRIRKEKISIDPDDGKILFIHTKDRRYVFQFLTKSEASLWCSACQWYSKRSSTSFSSTSTKK